MTLSYKARRRWALFVLVVALPLYIVVAVNVADWLRATLGELSILSELLLFVTLGILWILPLRPIFRGVGQSDPDAPQDGQDS